ncbi:MAG: hypothetical protein HY901_07330 [Deltaproteobacteria bacterium]|nr:hypothetical protein [Deltaproteobacteria bacterium]
MLMPLLFRRLTSSSLRAFLEALVVPLALACSEPSAEPPDAGPHAGADAAVVTGEGDAGGWDAAPISLDAAIPGQADAAAACVAAEQWTRDGGYLQDGWNWQKRGLVWPAQPTPDSYDGDLAPALVEAEGALHLLFTRKTGLVHRIWHATSIDGEVWTAPAQVSGLAGDTMIAYPSVIHEPGRFMLWFDNGRIDFAQSVDGLLWTMAASGALDRGAEGTFDSLGVLYPCVVSNGAAGYTLWYSGLDGVTGAVGRATSGDGKSFTRDPTTAVLEHGPAGSWDNRAVTQPCVVRSAGRYLLWYGAYDTSKTDPGPYRVASAESADGVAWTRRGVALELAPSGPDAYSTRDPAVIRWRGGWLMVYAGLGDDLRYRLLRATSQACP